MPVTEYAVQAEGLVKEFGDVKALNGIDLVVPRGKVVGLLGPNGSGKTTTVRILATLLKATSGSAQVNGFDVQRQADDVRRSIGLTGQYAAVDEFLTGRENLTMFGGLFHLEKKYVASRCDELLHKFDLADAADRPAKTYSGGMRRRLDLAAGLLHRPRLLVLDEPTVGLDIESVVIDQGQVIAHGTSSELKDQIGGDRIEITLNDEQSAARAVDALSGVVSGEPTTEGAQYSAPVAGGSSVLIDAVRALDAQNVGVADIALRRPTLDDVFLTLTGHGAEDQQPERPEPSRRGRRGGRR